MAEKNKHGLNRYLPPLVKQKVRQRCYFGCIVCGSAIIQYHHFDPEFVDAKEHNPNGITLLCPTCHEKVKKKIFTQKFIEEKNKTPYCKTVGFTKDIFYFGSESIAFKLGNAWFKRLNVILYDGKPLISFSPPESENSPMRLNAILYDKDENELLKIINNEWITGIEHFDIETTSNHLIIREKKGAIKLHLSHIANEEISIQKIDMNYKGFKIMVQNSQFSVESPTKTKLQLSCPNIFASLKLRSNGSIAI